MLILKTKSEVRDFTSKVKSQGKTIGFVPTMGALHAGHISLVETASQNADVTICSIFVNPTQFGANEDFSKYPRTENEDISKLEQAKCDAVFLPSADELYSDINFLKIIPQQYTNILCGAFRTGHFDGVCLVVSKLFNIVTPNVAIFGEKDFQQLFIIKKMVEALDFNIKIIGGITLRETDGLAMSSRNKYLNDTERKIAGSLNKLLKEALLKATKTNNLDDILLEYTNKILANGFSKIDYLELREQDTLDISKKITSNTRIFFAGYLGKTRLIDNILISHAV